MISKRFLFPILAIAALALPASASIVEYCSGTNPSCATFSQTAFNSVVTGSDYAYASGTPLNFVGVLSSDTYTDSLTGVSFVDFAGGSPSGTFTDSGGTLSSPLGDFTIAITIPATYLAIVLNVNVGAGLCGNYCTENQTTGFVAFINNDSPTVPWTINISPAGSAHFTEIVSFDVAGAGTTDTGGGETPEVATFILIGAGLISMRWMRRAQRRVFRTWQPA
jgi:hypothetical protein